MGRVDQASRNHHTCRQHRHSAAQPARVAPLSKAYLAAAGIRQRDRTRPAQRASHEL